MVYLNHVPVCVSQVMSPVVQTPEEARACATVLSKMRACASIEEREEVCVPIFTTSAVTGTGLQLLHGFLRGLEPARRRDHPLQQRQGGVSSTHGDLLQGLGGLDLSTPSEVQTGIVPISASKAGSTPAPDPVLFQVGTPSCSLGTKLRIILRFL